MSKLSFDYLKADSHKTGSRIGSRMLIALQIKPILPLIRIGTIPTSTPGKDTGDGGPF